MLVLRESRYSVFGSPTFRGNPVTLFEVDALEDSAAILQTARRSRTEDNVFYSRVHGEPERARFFSSTAELWLCGHGLLALSHHLCVPGQTGPRAVQAPSGLWQIHVDAHGPGVTMPAQAASEITDPAHWMKQALHSIGIRHQRLYLCANAVWIALLRDMADLSRIDAADVAALPCGNTTPGALIAAIPLQDAAYGFRYFAPWHGKAEDSGTGSAHCYLAPLIARSMTGSLLRSAMPVAALQFSPQGVAEAHIRLRDDVVMMSGRVDPLS